MKLGVVAEQELLQDASRVINWYFENELFTLLVLIPLDLFVGRWKSHFGRIESNWFFLIEEVRSSLLQVYKIILKELNSTQNRMITLDFMVNEYKKNIKCQEGNLG